MQCPPAEISEKEHGRGKKRVVRRTWQSFVYLKPVDEKQLSEGIMRAVARRREQERLGSVERQNAFLQEHSHLIEEQFWTELMRGAFEENSDLLRIRIQKDRLQIDPKAHYTIVLLRVLPVLGRDIDEYLRVYGPRFKKELLEFYQDTYYQTVYSFIGSSGTLGLCLRLEPEVMNLMDIRSTAWRFIECMKRREQTQIVGIVGSITDLYGIFSEFVKLRRLIAEQIDIGERVLSFPEAKYERKIDYNMPDLEIWESLLSNGGCDSLRSLISDFLEQRAKKKQMDRYVLKMFRMDIEQLIYRYLRDRHVEMHKLFDNREAQKLADLSVQSVGCMKQYADYLIERSMEYTAIAEQPLSLVEQAREYLDAHYCEPISRNDLTDVVYLNQDYLSRLFKKETGLSINTYLIEKRIDKAKKLLTESTLPVHAVSMEVGYSNFAYFSKLFREKNRTDTKRVPAGQIFVRITADGGQV